MKSITPHAYADQLSESIQRAQKFFNEALILAKSGRPPDEWPEPLIQVYAQAVHPRHAASLPLIGREIAKGLLLHRYFYASRITVESLPTWITVRAGHRDPSLEHAAERLRHRLMSALRRGLVPRGLRGKT